MLHVRAIRGRLEGIWSQIPSIDWLAALLITGVHVAYAHHIGSSSAFETLSPDRRSNVYMTAASVSALVGGFGTAAISQYATANGRRMIELRRRFGAGLRRNWAGILTSMLIISAGCLYALMRDNSNRPGLLGWCIECLFVLGALRSLRLIWLFGLLIDVADYDVTEPVRSPAVRIPPAPQSEDPNSRPGR
jgi:hypothetical protein